MVQKLSALSYRLFPGGTLFRRFPPMATDEIVDNVIDMTDRAPSVAMIFAAGRGQRMQPLSDVLPKPALLVPGGPVVSWGFRLALRAGIRSAVVNSWWLAETMERTAAESLPSSMMVQFSREKTLMDTAGGLALARDRGLLGSRGPVLVINGDGVLDLDLEALIDRHRESDDLVTLGLLPHLGPERWSRVLLDRNGLVSAILPPGNPAPGEIPLLYPGVMVVAREALDSLESRPSGVASMLWGPAIAQQRLGGMPVSGHWQEIGTPADYLDHTLALLGDRTEVHASAAVAEEALLSRALIGPGVTINPKATLDRSIVSHGAVIGEGAKILRSIVLGEVQIPAGATVTDEVRTG